MARFPEGQYKGIGSYVSDYAGQVAVAFESIDTDRLQSACDVMLEAYQEGRRLYSCGNGGSASIANHLQCDHTKGVRTGTDLKPKTQSLSSNIEVVTAISNDISYDDVYSYQLQSLGMPGDVLVCISSSGNSENVVRALQYANEIRMRSIALCGFDGGQAANLAEFVIHVASHNYGVVEDVHQSIMHILAQYIRQDRMPADAVRETTF